MAYNAEQIANLNRNKREIVAELKSLQERFLLAGSDFEADWSVREHIDHGAARRLGTLIHAVERVFAIFPPETATPLDRAAHFDVAAHLHAFLINLCGIFDNWAWAFVLRHDLMSKIGDRRRVGLFHPKTMSFLPPKLRSYLNKDMADWQRSYLTNYRDSLAHRVPPYVPPMQVSTENGDRWRQIWDEVGTAIKAHDWDRVNRLEAERARLESPCFLFALGTSGKGAIQVWFHSQMLGDCRTVAAIGERFLDDWHSRGQEDEEANSSGASSQPTMTDP